MSFAGTGRRPTPEPPFPRRVIAWGTYDLGKPRTRILIRGLRDQGVEIVECHRSVWEGIEDKSQVPARRWLGLALRWLAAYPGLVIRYLRAPRHDLVLVAYPGVLDVLVVFPWARLRRVPVVWDVFIPLYDVVVEDRRLVSPRHPVARLLARLEGTAARRAARVLLDTRAQAEHFAAFHRLAGNRVGRVRVGVEPESFPAAAAAPPHGDPGVSRPIRVLFYGQMIPLHGIRTVLEAAGSDAGRAIEWRIIGDGQEGGEVERTLRGGDLPHVEWNRWVPYPELHREIERADVCLGVFGTTPKAARVIPNKVYQALAAGRPLVTRDGPGIRELLGEEPSVRLVPPGDPGALVAAILDLAAESCGAPPSPRLRGSILPAAVGQEARAELAMALAHQGASSPP
jgi:glycosyltransferase involved in cell wall biosynthesis